MTDVTAPAQAPAPPRPGRGLGTAALVLSLIPIIIGIAWIPIAIIASLGDDSGWAILGWTLFGILVFSVAGLVLGVIAIVLGSIAAKRNRGRGAGIAAIVIGSITLLASIPALLTQVMSL